MKTYLDRSSFDYKYDYDGSNIWKEFAIFQGRRETLYQFDPTRPAIFLLYALQAGLTPSESTVTLPNGIVIPQTGNPLNYVQAFGTVNAARRQLTITAVNESAGTVTFSETVDTGTTVDVYCIPRIPLLVSFRIANIETGAKIEREIYVADISADAERDYWKSKSVLTLPTAYPIPEDWLLKIYVRCSLPLKWTDTSNVEIQHRIFLPVDVQPAAGKQEAIKGELMRTLAL